MPTKITAWSYSRLSVFRACRLQFKFKFIDKLPEAGSPAMERGNIVHKDLQKYLEGKSKALTRDEAVLEATGPKSGLAKYYAALRKLKPACELQVAVTEDWRRTGWFDKDAWLRVIYDVVVQRKAGTRLHPVSVLEIGDHKTGQIRPDQHAEQLEIFTAAAPALFPNVDEYHATMYYPDHGLAPSPAVFTPKDVERFRKKWTKEAAPIFKEKRFPAAPGQACRWCHFSGRRGGPCTFG